jgi:predicted AlkP superfamily phosphohydrolase/phosphomutase
MSPYKLYSFVRSLGFKKVQSTFRGGPNEQILTKITLSYKDIDWEKTKAFSFGVGGGIYINVNGKEKMGCVNPEEYEIVREQIIKVLYSVRDSKEHKSIIKAIYKKEEIYGENINAPDLIFLTNEGYATLHLSQFVSSSLFEKAQSTGTHSPDGILLVYGRDIRKGFKITHSKIQDIAPTILHIFNVPIPHYMDGKVLKELFQQKSDIYKRPIYRKKLLKGLELTKKIQELRSKLNM